MVGTARRQQHSTVPHIGEAVLGGGSRGFGGHSSRLSWTGLWGLVSPVGTVLGQKPTSVSPSGVQFTMNKSHAAWAEVSCLPACHKVPSSTTWPVTEPERAS
jgi:hypothetical protein